MTRSSSAEPLDSLARQIGRCSAERAASSRSSDGRHSDPDRSRTGNRPRALADRRVCPSGTEVADQISSPDLGPWHAEPGDGSVPGCPDNGRTTTCESALPQDEHRLPSRLRRVLAGVDAEPGRPVTLGELAAVADGGTATVTRLFRQYLGSSPLAWVLDVRIDAAKTLLTRTRLPVNQIARRVGFADAYYYYYSRQFRARTGPTPSAWRRLRSAQ